MTNNHQYLLTSLKHDYRFGTEDRLTQVIAATYNSSTKFKKLFLRFLNISPSKSVDTFAETQVHGSNSRPDIIIFKKNKRQNTILITIESKLKIKKAKNDQINKHIGKNKYLIAYHGDDETRLPTGCKLRYWQDLAAQLHEFIDSTIKDNSAEAFILKNTLEYFKRTDMLKAQEITKTDFTNIKNFFLKIRNDKNPTCDIDKFMLSMKNFQDVCTQAIDRFSSSEAAPKRFIPKMSISSWTNRDLKDGRRYLEIHKDLAFSNVMPNGVKRIFLSYMEKPNHKDMIFIIGAANKSFNWNDENTKTIKISNGVTVNELHKEITTFYKKYEKKKKVY